MTPERWETVKALLSGVLARPPTERAAFLADASGTDAELRREVESLLQAGEGTDGFLESPPVAGLRFAEGTRPDASDLRARLQAALADRYAVERELGRGGMATVYFARDLKHDRPVALKVMHPELAQGLGPERFLREVRLAARLQHPHILPMHDSGETDGMLWYTMPFVAGESLRDRLRRETQLPIDQAVDLARQVALALDHAHRAGIVHRDLKPENILLSESQALVADFGVAKALTEAGEGQITAPGMAVGTPTYMAPEQASGNVVDARSDVYALGCVLYEMLAGEPPFTGRSAQAVLAKRVLEPVPHVRTLRDSVPEALDQALIRALAKSPADRFASAAHFARALAEAGEGRAGGAAAPRAVTGSARRTSTGRLIAAGVSAVITLGLGAAALLWRPRSAPAALDADLVAVAPFDVLAPAPELALWREGLVDLLARGIDGAGPLRTVSPSVVIRRWKGRADRVAAGAMAKQLGAGLAVYGTLVAAGRDSVRLSASVLDAARDQVVAETEAWGPAGHVDQLADSLALRLLRQVGRGRSLVAVRWGGLGTRSLPALRAFLRGEQFFRRTEWDSARGSYERAVALDTGFALAYWRLGASWAWHEGARDSLADAYFLQAFGTAGRGHGLPPRETLLIVFDSLMSSLDEAALPDSAVEGRVARLFRTAEELTHRYPADPEAWAALGEASVHFGLGRGVGREKAFEALTRAIALDSAYAPAYIHVVELAATLDNRPALRRYTAAFLASQPQQELATAARTAVRLVTPPTSGDEAVRLLDTLPMRVFPTLIYAFRAAPDSEQLGLAVWRQFLAGPLDQDFPGIEESARSGYAATLAFRGHMREAANVLARTPGLMAWGTFTDLALAGLVPADTAEVIFRRQLRDEPTRGDGMAPRVGFPLPWWAARGDSIALKRYAERLRPRGPTAEVPLRNRYLYGAASAYLALVRRDTADAVLRLQALPAVAGQVWYERLMLARLLAGLKREREALAVLDREFTWAVPVRQHVTWALERARLAERLREPEKARRWYDYVARVWRHGDPEVQPYVAEAHAALVRVSAQMGK